MGLTTSVHTHATLCVQTTAPEVYFDNLGIDKGIIIAIVDAIRVTGMDSIADSVLKGLGINKFHFEQFMKIYQSNMREVSQMLLDEMKEAGIDRAVNLMLDMAPACEEEYVQLPWKQQVDFAGDLFEETDGKLIPFYGFDPRRKDAFKWVQYAVEKKNFKGLKFYPKLGYNPDFKSGDNTPEVNRELYLTYDYCHKNKIPIVTHTSGGGIRGNLSEKTADEYAMPQNWFNVFMSFPHIKVCFAHFGGNACFIETMKRIEKDGEAVIGKLRTSTDYIIFLMREFEGAYGDISFHEGYNTPAWQNAMRTLMELTFPPSQVLGGDDYPLIKIKYGLKDFYGTIRKELGEWIWKTIMIDNPRDFLGF